MFLGLWVRLDGVDLMAFWGLRILRGSWGWDGVNLMAGGGFDGGGLDFLEIV